MPRRGFTLIEVLVSLFILSLMAGMAWQGVDMVVRTRAVAQGRLDQLLRLQSTLAQWETDLREVMDTQTVPGLAFDGATLRLTRRQPDGVQVVAWTLRGQTLERWAPPPVRDIDQLQETWLRSYQLLGGEPETLRVLDHLATWQMFYFFTSSNAWSNAQSSADQQAAAVTVAPPANGASGAVGNPGEGTGTVTNRTAAAQRDALPDGVRVQFNFSPDGGAATGSVTRTLQLVHP